MTFLHRLHHTILAALASFGTTALAQEPSTCVTCHAAKSPRISEQFAADVHRHESVGCVGCHGGNPRGTTEEAAHDAKTAGFRGAIAHRDVPDLCASCHGDAKRMGAFGLRDIVGNWRASPHAKLSPTGDAHVAACTRCHGTHGILSRKDMRSPTHPTRVPRTCSNCHADEYAYLMRSPHRDSLRYTGSPSCVQCHDGHSAAIPKDVVATCRQCHESADDAGLVMAEKMSDLLGRAEIQLRALDTMIAGHRNPGDETKLHMLEAERDRLQSLFHRTRKVSHSLDLKELDPALLRIEESVKTVAAVTATDIDAKHEFSTPIVVLIFIGLFAGLLLVSMVLAYVTIRLSRRLRRRNHAAPREAALQGAGSQGARSPGAGSQEAVS